MIRFALGGLLKNAMRVPLPHGRGSVNHCKHEKSVLSRARQQALGIAAAILDLLREIGDENAYARHLSIHGVVHSGEEWRRFTDERFRARYQRAKCC